MKEKKLPAKIEHLHDVLDFIAEIPKQHDINEDKIRNMQIAIEEVFVNICNHAYDEDNQGINIRCYITDDDLFCIEITDWGKPFNILNSKDPDIKKDIDDRDIGGLGIWLVKNLSDRITYKRIEDKNILEIGFRLSSV